MNKLRLLIHPEHDAALFNAVTNILETAVMSDPDTFDHIVGEPGRVDHYGYHTDTLSSVIMSQEYNSQYHRLTINIGEHPAYDAIHNIVLAHYAIGA